MKFPETAEDIESEILISSDKSKEIGDLRIKQLIKILPKVNSEIIVEGVIRIFESERGLESNLQEQEFAGRVLEEINPISSKDLKEILQRTLKNWNKSVEQFPFWLCNNYGASKLNEIFAELELSEYEEDKLKTVKWWLKIHKPNKSIT